MASASRTPAGPAPAPAPAAAVRRRRRPRLDRERALAVIAPLVLLALLLGTWQAGVWNDLLGVKPFTLPAPSAIWEAFGESGDELRDNTLVTLLPAMLGYAIGNGLGVLAGMALTSLPRPTAARLSAALIAVQATPLVALAPLVSLYIGAGTAFKATIVAIMCFPSMVVWSQAGFTSVETSALEYMDSMEATRRQVFRKLRFPAAVPYMFTALQYTTVLALIGAIVCETLKGRNGLGYLMIEQLAGFDAPLAWAALVTLSAIGIAWYAAIGVLEALVAPWKTARRPSR